MIIKTKHRHKPEPYLCQTWMQEPRPNGDSTPALPFRLGASDAFVPRDQDSPLPPLQKDKLTFMSWNIARGFAYSGKSEEEAGAEVIKKEKPDIVGLQEVPSLKWLDSFQESHLGAEAYPYRILIEGNDRGTHVALLSRFPIQKVYTYRDPRFSMDDNMKPTYFTRDFPEAIVEVTPKMKMKVFVTHFHGGQRNVRYREGKIAHQIIKAHLEEDPSSLIAVLADLNDRPQSRTIRHLNGESGLLSDPLKLEKKENEPTRGPVRDDYILVSSKLLELYVPGSAGVIHSEDSHQASDHDPVIAKFRVAS